MYNYKVIEDFSMTFFNGKVPILAYNDSEDLCLYINKEE